eukprot:3710540-Lingulodinium_polyedra.AAC.1
MSAPPWRGRQGSAGVLQRCPQPPPLAPPGTAACRAPAAWRPVAPAPRRPCGAGGPAVVTGPWPRLPPQSPAQPRRSPAWR